MPSIFDLVAHSESSGGLNLYNPVSTSSGHAEGNFGITTGTWKDFAPKAGVDLTQYPDPLGAPVNVQQQVASVIPYGRWDSNTQSYVSSQLGYNPSSNLTLGQIQSQIDSGEAADISSFATTMGGDTSGLPSVPIAFGNDPSANSPDSFLIPGTDTSIGPSGFGQIFNFDGAGNVLPNTDPTSGAAISGNVPVSPSSTGLGSIFSTISDLAIRGGLVVLGIVLIAIGGFAAVHGETVSVSAGNIGRKVL